MLKRLRNTPLYALAGVAVFAMVLLGLSIVWRAQDQQRLEEGRTANCQEIEILKAHLRPPPFDLADTKQILRDLNVDPSSAVGKRLIKRSRETTREERARFAPSKC